MAPRTRTASKTKPKRKTSSNSRPSGPSTNALLKRILAAVDRSGATTMDAGQYRRPLPPQQSILSNYGYQNHNYQAPTDYLEEYTRDSQPFVRMVCAPGQRPDYEGNACVKAFSETGRCPKDKVWDPFTGDCTDQTIKPRIGWTWEGDRLVNVGSAANAMGGWAFAKKLPLASEWGQKVQPVPR